MRKPTIDENRRCPKCGKVEKQVDEGFYRSGTRRRFCRKCCTNYTLDPKQNEYSEEQNSLR